MSNLTVIPFMEQVERVKAEFVRDDSLSATVEDQYKGRLNDISTQEIPSRIDWRHLTKRGAVAAKADYDIGTITSISGTTVTGSGTSWTSANSNGYLFKHDSFDEIYRATYVSGTSLTLDQTWQEGSVTAGDTYSLVLDRYQLASDFDSIADDPNRSVYWWSAGAKQYLHYVTPDEYDETFTHIEGDPNTFSIFWSNDTPYIHINPTSDEARTIYYDYNPRLTYLTEYKTGTAQVTNASTSVVGTSTDFDGYVTGTDTFYFRIDTDGAGASSVWYAISSASSDTAITLSSAYTGASASGKSYTICKAFSLPPTLQLAAIYKAATLSSTNQNNSRQVKEWNAFYEQLISQFTARENKLPPNQRVRTVYEGGARR